MIMGKEEMSLKDRIKAKKEAKSLAAKSQYNISIKKLAQAASKMQNADDLGNIVREFAKFMNSLEPQNAKIVFSGDFDMGQRTLLNCLLASFLEDDDADIQTEETQETDLDDVPTPKLIKKRKSIKSRILEKESVVEE